VAWPCNDGLNELPFEMVSEWAQGIGHAHWRHLANMVERLCVACMSESATKNGDTICSPITFGNFIKVFVEQTQSF